MSRRLLLPIVVACVVIVSSVLARGAGGQAVKGGPPKVGEMVPAFVFDVMVPAPASTGLTAAQFSSERLRGRVVVLDFFASWCGPCLALIPHTNAVKKEVEHLPVTFLAVGYEALPRLERTLGKYSMQVPMVHDKDGSTFEDFWVGGLPAVAIIGADGRLLAFTHPSAITKAVIEDAIAGRVPDVKPMAHTDVKRAWIDIAGPEPATTSNATPGAATPKATIEETDKLNGMVRSNSQTGQIIAPGVRLRSLLLIALGSNGKDLDVRVPLDDQKIYTAEIQAPDQNITTAKAMLRSLIETTFKLSITQATVDTDVYLLTRRADAAPFTAPAPSDSIVRRAGTYQMRNATMADLAFELSRIADRPIVDRTGLDGRHSFDLMWDLNEGPDAMKRALAGLGFGIERGKSPVQKWVVDKMK